jgi:hypothetical protein
MNPKQEEIYHELVLAAEPLLKMHPQEIQEVLQTFVNRMNTRLQLKTEPVPFLERIDNPTNK